MANRGASYHQDPFIKNKQRKLFASRSWPSEFSDKVNMSKVSIEALRPWVGSRVTKLMGTEDDIVSEYCIAQLEAYDPIEGQIDPREVQLNLEGFLGEPQAQIFMEELWKLLLSAQSQPGGVPPELIQEQKREEEARARKAEEERMEAEKRRRQEDAFLKREQEKRIAADTSRKTQEQEYHRRRRRTRSRSRSRSRDRRQHKKENYRR